MSFIFLRKVENTVDLVASEDEGGQDIFFKANEFATVPNSEHFRELTMWKRTWIFLTERESGKFRRIERVSKSTDYLYSVMYVRLFIGTCVR